MSGPAWQQGSAASGSAALYGPEPPPPPASAGSPPDSGGDLGKGLFGVLLDRSFDELVTVRLLRILYTVALVCITGCNGVLFLFGWSLAAGRFWPALGWVMVT